MVIVRLMGGLGNQMFQYAAGRSLALRHGTSLKLDLSFLEGEQTRHTRRAYELDHFNIIARKAEARELSCVASGREGFLPRTVSRLFGGARIPLYRETQFNVNPDFFRLPDRVYLEGYWQSEAYFRVHEEAIRRELAPTTPPTGRNLELVGEIRAVNAVSLHVRRGDYVTDPVTAAAHQVCTLDYYRKAAELVADSLPAPHFFVFSDDPEWVSANLKLPHPTTFVTHNREKGYEDLRLMSLCRHHVIANSSFSWWGAWLNPRPDKVVVAPSRWFNELPADTRDLIPQGWRRI